MQQQCFKGGVVVAGIVHRKLVLTACVIAMAAGAGGCAQQIGGLAEANDAGLVQQAARCVQEAGMGADQQSSLDTISTGPVGPESLSARTDSARLVRRRR